MAVMVNQLDGEAIITDCVKSGFVANTIKFANDFGQSLARNDLSTSQIRNVYGEVKRIQMKGEDNTAFETEILLLKPKLMYAKVRGQKTTAKNAMGDLATVLSKGIDTVFELETRKEQFERFERFAAFFEAVIAYHRAAGGK